MIPNGCKLYLPKNVLEAAIERIAWIFDHYENVCVSVSGGKDSSVLVELARREAERRGRVIHVFFLDQEVEYRSTVEVMRYIMTRPAVKAHWVQVPIRMTNATSYEDEFLYAWGPGEEWVRPKEPDSIHELPDAPDRFYSFFDWWEAQWPENTACLVGLRAEESLNRFGAVTRHPAIPGINWSSPGGGKSIKFYPLYDWTFEDIWTFIGNEGPVYNRVYDWMWAKGRNIGDLRVSNLIHERAFKSLADLQEFEPDTYDALIRRLKGVHTAALYSREQMVFSTKKRPAQFSSWRAYRDFLLETLPNERRQQFLERFGNQLQSESVFRQQVRQLLLNDWENNIPVVQQPDRPNPLLKWMDIL